MRRFKKIAALALAAVMTLSLAACGNAGTNVSDNSGNVSDTAAISLLRLRTREAFWLYRKE